TFRLDGGLIDIGLPGVDGYEVARRLRATDEGKRMLLVALTGYGQPEDRRRARAAGADPHPTKRVPPAPPQAAPARAARGGAHRRLREARLAVASRQCALDSSSRRWSVLRVPPSGAPLDRRRVRRVDDRRLIWPVWRNPQLVDR